MKNKWKYHVSHSYKEGEKEFNCITQLYKIGIYGMINNMSHLQFSTHPKNMEKLEKRLRKQYKDGLITDLIFGDEIIVQEVDGFFIKLEN